MSAEKMDELLSLIGPELIRRNTNYRAAIEPKQRLSVGLRYLASGDSLVSLAYSYRLGHTTVANSVHMVCAAIEQVMMEGFLPRPTKDTTNQTLLDEGEQLGRHMAAVRNMGGNRASREACNVREAFCTFFNSPEGSVSWQDRMV
ncbi:uncharacterized protein V6R79_023069 [Siganus canaliculatus]